MEVQGLPGEPRKKTSPWVWIGLGCGGILVLCVILVLVIGFILFGKARNFAKQFDDPVVRDQRVREVLGASDLPSGYYPMMTISIPWVLDLAMLSDRQMKKEDFKGGKNHNGFDKAGFIYVETPFNKHGRNYDKIFEGKEGSDEILKNSDVRFRNKEEVARGNIPGTDGSKLHYRATRGEVEIGKQWVEGITTLIAVECPNDTKFRLGIWFGPDPTSPGSGDREASGRAGADSRGDEGRTAEDEDASAAGDGENGDDEPSSVVPGKPDPAALAGSPADEAAIKDFMSHFSLCT